MQVGITETITGIGSPRLISDSGSPIAAFQARWVDSGPRSPSSQRRNGRRRGSRRSTVATIASSVSTRAIPSTIRYSESEPS